VLIIWRGTTTRDFFVRNACYMEKERVEATHGNCSYQFDLYLIWNRIWGRKVPNSLKNFLWRACHDTLPTRDNLKCRGIDLVHSCIFCSSEWETVMHILWSCPSALNVWGDCGKKIGKCSNTGNLFLEVLEFMFDNFVPEEVEFFVDIARRLWIR
jgi:hypothetical protein